jgi:hypothetical protein
MMAQYKLFRNQYGDAFSPMLAENAVTSGKLPDFDRGSFVIGETCFRKSKLRFLLQTLLLEECFNRARIMEEDYNNEEEGSRLTSNTSVYTIQENEPSEFVSKQDALELAIADEKRFVPDVQIDDCFWENVDACRFSLANDDLDSYNDLVRRRAVSELSRMSNEGNACEDEKDQNTIASDEEDEEPHPKRPQNKRQRAKRKQVCDSDSEQECENGHAEEEEEEDECSERSGPARAGSSAMHGNEGGGGGRFVASAPARRQAPPSIGVVAGMLRADKVLPSRQVVLRSLMALQLRLEKDGFHGDATTCTAAVLTIQDLLQRNEELAASTC